MKVVVTEILDDLRDLYRIEDRFRRFEAYVSLSSGKARGGGKARGEPLPLGTFSPMGQRQAGYLEQLIAMGAEGLAQVAADEVAEAFADLTDRFRLMLVVADVPKNGWTERQLTDAEWRFTLKNDTLPESTMPTNFDRWVSVLLWTDTEATKAYVESEVRGALYRALHHRYVGAPRTLTLGEMMRQEGRVLAYAGYVPKPDVDLDYSRVVIAPYLQSTEFPVCFAALYGDAAARQVGYDALGLAADAGFQLALHDTLADETRTSLILRMQAGNKQVAPHLNTQTVF